MNRTAVLVDGGFFHKRFRTLYGTEITADPAAVASELYAICKKHLRNRPNDVDDQKGEAAQKGQTFRELYRIYYYDCEPVTSQYHRPVSNKSVNMAKTQDAIFQKEFLKALSKSRKVALRLGKLHVGNPRWRIRENTVEQLLAGTRVWTEITDDDFTLNVRQKGVDMRIGIDITLLAEKRLVDQIVLIAGDSDFVPAAKHARREGIDFILDPMWASIADDLAVHIDGLRSTARRKSS